MKESRYNIWVERAEGAYVFNGVSGTLLHVPGKERNARGDPRLVAFRWWPVR
jgi:hypothetical protein